ncbi:MAG TPA: quinolinate synthase NadA [Dehalococcoidales bacterium]
MTLNGDLSEKILKLKVEKNAVILAHNYQLGEVQDIADFVGDSLELSQKAAKTEAAVIVFCGVHFMAETASILSPDKIVLLPDLDAGCPMANMITAAQLIERKIELPNAKVVCYVNTTADVKAESDVCCTSANAVKVVNSIEANEILFVPDQYLGHYVSTKTDKKIYLWPGYCPTHARILPEDINREKAAHPAAKVLVHPECRPETIALADEVLSTGGMARYARENPAKEIIVGTEIGFVYRLRKENPGKYFYPASEQAVCPRMKLITLEKILWCLEQMAPEVKVPENVRFRAKQAVDKMLEIGA